MAMCCISLIEAGIFHRRQVERVRMLVNRIPETSRSDDQVVEVVLRLHAIENSHGEPAGADQPATRPESKAQ